MPGSGPRVGGAHVDVDLQFDSKSLDVMGARISKQLSEIGRKNGATYRAIGENAVRAWRSMLASIVTAAPIAAPAISALTSSLTLLAGSMYSVGQASYALLPVLTSLGFAMLTLKTGFSGIGRAVSEFDPKRLQKMLDAMSPSAREFTLAIRAMKKELNDKVTDHIFAGLLSEMEQLKTGVIPIVTKGFLDMADALNGLFKEVLQYANSEAGMAQISSTLTNQVEIFKHLSKAVVPFLDGFLGLLDLLTPAAIRLSDHIAKLALNFQNWSNAAGAGDRIDAMMQRAEKTAGLLFKVIGNLGSALGNVFGATNPATNSMLQMFVDLTQKFEDFTASASGQNKIAKWAEDGLTVMRAFGHVIAEVFKFGAAIGDSRVLVSVLQTIADAFAILGKLPLESLASKFADLMEALDPISGPILAAIIAFGAFNLVLGNIAAQIGGAVLALGKLVGSVGKHSTPLSNFIALFKDFGSILAKNLKFVGLAGLAITIGIIIAKSKTLRVKVGQVFEELKNVFSEFGNAIGELYTAFKPLFKSIDDTTAALMPLAEFLIGLALDVIIIAFKALAFQIKIFAKVVSTVLPPIIAIFTKIIDVVVAVYNAVSPILIKIAAAVTGFVTGIVTDFNGFLSTVQTVMGVVVTVFTTAWNIVFTTVRTVIGAIVTAVQFYFNLIRTVITTVLGVVSGFIQTRLTNIKNNFTLVFNAVKSVVTSVIGTIKSTITNGIDAVVSFVRGIPGKIRNLASSFLEAGKNLGSKIIKGLWEGLKKLGGGAADFARAIKDAINNALNLPFKIGGKFGLPSFTIPKFAGGTGYAPGGLALLGEQGPELAYLPRGSKVKTASQTRSILNDSSPSNLVGSPGPMDLSKETIDALGITIASLIMSGAWKAVNANNIATASGIDLR